MSKGCFHNFKSQLIIFNISLFVNGTHLPLFETRRFTDSSSEQAAPQAYEIQLLVLKHACHHNV